MRRRWYDLRLCAAPRGDLTDGRERSDGTVVWNVLRYRKHEIHFKGRLQSLWLIPRWRPLCVEKEIRVVPRERALAGGYGDADG